MRLASYLVENVPRYGAVTERGIVDLTRRLDIPSLKGLIAAGALPVAARAVEGAPPDYAVEEVTFLPPVIAPEKIWCIGINYQDRNAEYRDGSELPRYPSLFARVPGSIVGHGEPIVRPRVSAQLDYEGELVLVIGREGRHVPRERAFEHVFGLTLCNEGTVRDWVRHGKFNVTQGKNFDRSGSIGPWIVTADELDPSGAIEITTRVNGELRQHDSTARLIFAFDQLIAYLTTFATLTPGDMIATGTPTGAGTRFDPPRWLAPGDVVEISSPAIGVLRNGVIDEA
jgi:2-keto-4-pentenoate hydratase/2-oxohepta-3-ene-1,7-dioic acid hydratase in catechol pathway